MDKRASEIMGEPVLVALTVASRGEAGKMAAGAVGGLVGGMVGKAMTGKSEGATTPGNYTGPMFLTLGPSKLAFFTLKQGFFKNSAGELLAEHARADIVAFELEGGFVPNFSIQLADGTRYSLECGRMYLKQVKKIKEELGK